MKSKNMNYLFHVEYYENIDLLSTKQEEDEFSKRNSEITGFRFSCKGPLDQWELLEGFRSFVLDTQYPGLLLGTGVRNGLSVKNVFQCGFEFDYVTGLPYLPGSSLKGVLRSYFPMDIRDTEKKKELDGYIRGILGKGEAFPTEDFGRKLFEVKEETAEPDCKNRQDIFLGAFPVLKPDGQALLETDYITKHTKFKNPVPIQYIKVRPGVTLQFCFLLHDYYGPDGTVMVTAQEKADLFRTIILDMGVGGKTNVGFGAFGASSLRHK